MGAALQKIQVPYDGLKSISRFYLISEVTSYDIRKYKKIVGIQLYVMNNNFVINPEANIKPDFFKYFNIYYTEVSKQSNTKK